MNKKIVTSVVYSLALLFSVFSANANTFGHDINIKNSTGDQTLFLMKDETDPSRFETIGPDEKKTVGYFGRGLGEGTIQKVYKLQFARDAASSFYVFVKLDVQRGLFGVPTGTYLQFGLGLNPSGPTQWHNVEGTGIIKLGPGFERFIFDDKWQGKKPVVKVNWYPFPVPTSYPDIEFEIK